LATALRVFFFTLVAMVRLSLRLEPGRARFRLYSSC
jgi:hypothetical protein